jgi:hypothetical protein
MSEDDLVAWWGAIAQQKLTCETFVDERVLLLIQT